MKGEKKGVKCEKRGVKGEKKGVKCEKRGVKGEKKGVKCEKRGVKGEISRRDGENGIIYLAIGREYGRPEGKR